MDIAIWFILKSDVSTRSQPIFDSLKAANQSDWTKLDIKVVRCSCPSVKVRLRLTIKAEGGYFEIWSAHFVFEILLKTCAKCLVVFLLELVDW